MGLFVLVAMMSISSRPVVAVVEYRSGVGARLHLATRMAKVLKKRSRARVLGPQEVTMNYPGNFYDDLMACDEEPECMAKLGRKVGATDFLYLNINKLDNISINVMRISTRNGRVVAATDMDIPEGARISALQIYRMLQKLFPPAFFQRYGSIQIFSNVTGAEVFINGRKVGVVPVDKQVLPAGRRYVITVRKRGYSPFSMSLRLAPDADLKVDANLSRHVVVHGGRPWYKKWWVWAGTAVLVGVAAGTSYYLMRPTEAEGWVSFE